MRNTTATPAVEIAPAFPHAAAAPAMNNATVTPTSRNYPLLLASQFLGAFGDNALLVIMLGGVKRAFDAGRITAQQQQLENIFYTSVLFIPYVPLAPLAGFLNDRFAKSRWLLGGNLIKIAGALLTLLSVWHGAAWLAIGYAVVGV
ncbi:MAG: hypothetical protein HY301_13325, partial [Verrucomicrobia bacterium]|nr:hypothetical protein [Verrucomicrobiota bacterium]